MLFGVSDLIYKINIHVFTVTIKSDLDSDVWNTDLLTTVSSQEALLGVF